MLILKHLRRISHAIFSPSDSARPCIPREAPDVEETLPVKLRLLTYWTRPAMET